MLLALDKRGDVYVEDVERVWERPGEVEDLVCDTCFADDEEHGEPVLVSLPLDPGQASRHQRDAYARRLRGRFWRMTPEVGEKTNRIKPLSAHASRNPIRIVRAPWNDALIKELIDELDPAVFWQIHRSTLVNVNAIAGITRDFRGRQIVAVKGHPEKLEVSRSFTGLFKGM